MRLQRRPDASPCCAGCRSSTCSSIAFSIDGLAAINYDPAGCAGSARRRIARDAAYGSFVGFDGPGPVIANLAAITASGPRAAAARSMTPFALRDGRLHAEDVALTEIAAEFGTPCYVYSRAAITGAYSAFDSAFAAHPHQVCYAVKANSNLAVLNVLARLGAGFDIVSGGELLRVLAAGGDARKTIFSGVGKSESEIRLALQHDIQCFNVESAAELARIDRIGGEAGKRAPISFRINPDVDARTHRYISTGLKENKFGIAFSDALPLYRRAAQLANVRIAGIDFHLGSKMMDPTPALEAAEKVFTLLDALAGEGIALEHFDVGGGLGVPYEPGEKEADLAGYAEGLLRLFSGRREILVFEPGRYLVGNAGVLLTRVEYLKTGEAKNFAIVDAAMNDLIRPALYDAHHEIVPVVPRPEGSMRWEIVGPVCESADFLARDRLLEIDEGDLLAVMSAGAYAFAMSSNYNTRGRAAEVMVDGANAHRVRERESAPLLFCHESILPR